MLRFETFVEDVFLLKVKETRSDLANKFLNLISLKILISLTSICDDLLQTLSTSVHDYPDMRCLISLITEVNIVIVNLNKHKCTRGTISYRKLFIKLISLITFEIARLFAMGTSFKAKIFACSTFHTSTIVLCGLWYSNLSLLNRFLYF